MRTFLLAGAAALTLFAVPAAVSAQNAGGGPEAAAMAYTMTTDQRGMYDAWTADRRSAYDAWPGPYQTMFWSLTPDQQRGWWALTPEQRTMVFDLAPDARAQAFTSILKQLDGAPAAASVPAPSAGTVTYTNSGNATPPPAEAMNKTYPVCKRGQTDNCQNQGEGGAPGRSRALNHWPGKPASEGGR